MKIFRIAAAVVIAAIGLALMAIAPALAADPFGTWLTEDTKGKIHIVNCGGALCGNLVWIKEPLDPETNRPKLDKHNVDASKQEPPAARHSHRAQYETERHAGQMGRASLQRRGRQYLFGLFHHDRRQYCANSKAACSAG